LDFRHATKRQEKEAEETTPPRKRRGQRHARNSLESCKKTGLTDGILLLPTPAKLQTMMDLEVVVASG
jgi:hypothetical protein